VEYDPYEILEISRVWCVSCDLWLDHVIVGGGDGRDQTSVSSTQSSLPS